jgi:hypothetical protein
MIHYALPISSWITVGDVLVLTCGDEDNIMTALRVKLRVFTSAPLH